MSKSGKIIADNIISINIAKRMASALGNVFITDENNGIISHHTIGQYYKRTICDLVAVGATVEFGNKLSICCFNEYYENNISRVRGTQYQVVYNDKDPKKEYSRFFKSLTEAVDKFIELELKYGK